MEQIASLLEKGGIVMIPLLFCSVFMFAVAMERFWFYHKAKTSLSTLLPQLTPLLQTGLWQQAVELCQNQPGVPAKVASAGLNYLLAGAKPEGLENSLESAAAHWAAKLRSRLNYLDMIVTLSPLLGLLGTVTGMINTFSVLTIQTGQPSAITGGVGEALIATATGLCIAIIALIFHSIFVQWLDQIITDTEQVCSLLVDSVNKVNCHETA